MNKFNVYISSVDGDYKVKEIEEIKNDLFEIAKVIMRGFDKKDRIKFFKNNDYLYIAKKEYDKPINVVYLKDNIIDKFGNIIEESEEEYYD